MTTELTGAQGETFVVVGEPEYDRAALLATLGSDESAAPTKEDQRADDTIGDQADPDAASDTSEDVDLEFHELVHEDKHLWIIEIQRHHAFTRHTLRRDVQTVSVRIEDTPENHRFAMSLMMAARCATHGMYLADVAATESQLVGNLFLWGVLGGDRPLVLVNGMETVAYDEIAFDQAVDRIHDHLHNLTIQPADVTFVPTATVIGANVRDRSSRMPWYNGPTVVNALVDRIEPTSA